MPETKSVPILQDDHREDREALREALRAVTEAINRQDWSAVQAWLDPQVSVTMIDQSTLYGPDAIAEYSRNKLERVGSILVGLHVEPTPAAPAVFYGDTAVCTLDSADRFVFRNGKELLVQTKYTAVLVKRDGRWKLANLHGGTNAFNNPISYGVHRLLTGGVALAGVAGVLLGWRLGRKG